jgi:hypothetical protein
MGLVLITWYKAGARWKPQALTPGKAVVELFSNTLSAPRLWREGAVGALEGGEWRDHPERHKR